MNPPPLQPLSRCNGSLARKERSLGAGYRQDVRRHSCLRSPFNNRLSCMGNSLITSSPEIMGGTPVFAGTRVPVQTLFDYLEGGETIDDFLDGFRQ